MVYLFIPVKGEVSLSLFYVCFSLMLLSNFIYFKAKQKQNYLDFDTLFILVYCLVGFSTTFLYHDEDLFRAVFLGFQIPEEYVNKGNFLALIGLQSYLVGNLVLIKDEFVSTDPKVFKTTPLVIVIILLILVFIASGGVSYYRSEYNDAVADQEAGIAKHILILLIAAATALIGTELYNKKASASYHISWLAFSALFLLAGMLLWAGNRTATSQLILPVLGLYTLLFKNISFKKFILFAFSGIVFMWFIQRMRTSDQSLDLSNPIMLILDLTIPVRNTYTVFQYVDSHGFTYGESMLLGVSGVVPLMPSLVKSIFPDLQDGSAEVLTAFTFEDLNTPEEFRIGLGTTIIADIYLSFGLLGSIFLMFGLGLYINKITQRSLSLDYYAIIMLGTMLGNAIFIVRAGYVHPLRFVVLALVLAYLNRLIQSSWKR